MTTQDFKRKAAELSAEFARIEIVSREECKAGFGCIKAIKEWT